MSKIEASNPESGDASSLDDDQVSAAAPQAETEAYLRVLNQFSVSLIDIRTEEQLLWYAAREVVGRMGFVDCVIYLLDEDHQTLVQRAASGGKNPKDEVILNRLEIPVGQGITGHVANTGEPLLVANLQEDSRYLPDVTVASSEICVPLIYKGLVLGVIDCEYPRVDHFNASHMDILTTVASMISAKLVQVTTIDRLETTVEQLQLAERTQAALLRIAAVSQSVGDIEDFYREIHESVGGLMGADNLFFGIYDREEHLLDFAYLFEDGKRTEANRSYGGGQLDKTASGYVLRMNQPILLNKAQFVEHVRAGDFNLIGREPVSWLGVPFPINENLTGVLVVQSYDENLTYSEQDADLLTYVSQQISKALSNKVAREALRESEARFARAVAGSNEGIWDRNMETGEGWFSDRWAEIIGFRREEIEATFDHFLSLVHPDDKDAMFDAMDAHLKRRELYDLEFRMRHKDRHYVWVRSRGQAVWDEHGKPIRMSGSLQDMTEQKEAEEKLRRAQKLEAVGQLTGGIAHDFNNLLAVILGNLDFAIERRDAGKDCGDTLDLALQGALRGADLTKRLLAFSGQQSFEDRVLDANGTISGMIELLRRTLGEAIEIETVLAEEPCPAKFDPAQLESVILNLALNARDAMPKGGLLRLETQNCAASDNDCEGCSTGEVRISVVDNGSGMPDEVRERAMEPFFTTKEVGEGSGLGLSMVYGFAMQSEGRLVIDSTPGEGTSVHIYLPVSELETGTLGASDAPDELGKAGGETILVVEDNPDVQELVTLQLQELGYGVVIASDGPEAIGIIESAAELDLILSDVVLPGGIDGTEILERAKAARPDLPTVLMSGYPARSDENGSGAGISTPLLRKPFRKAEIARIISQALDNS